MELYTVDTPIGLISAYDNDIFTKQLKKNGEYNEQVVIDSYLKKYIQKSKFVVDVGAHIGYHSIAYCKINPNVRVIAFEPQKKIFELLEKNIKQNNVSDQIRPYNMSVGDVTRKTTLVRNISDGPNMDKEITYGDSHALNLGGVSLGNDGEVTQMTTIDTLQLTHLDFIKIDVEGAETLVLMGAQKTIEKCKPIICFEHNYKKLSDQYLSDIGHPNLESPFDFLKKIGYSKLTSIPYENFIAE